MFDRRREQIRRSLDEAGLWTTVRRGVVMILNRRRFLRREPVLRLAGRAPAADFDAGRGRARIAVQIHLYYVDQTDEMIAYLNRIPYRFDCYVSTDGEEKAARVRAAFAASCRADSVTVACFPNRGRDVAPMIEQMAPVIGRYDYFCHLHTKRSGHGAYGDRWRLAVLDTLLDSREYVAEILDMMERTPSLGLVFQRTYWRVKPSLGWRGNKSACAALLGRMGIDTPLPRQPDFPVGDMFWARTAAVLPVFARGPKAEDFPEERGQLDGTPAHAIERCWAYVACARGFDWARVKPSRKARREQN